MTGKEAVDLLNKVARNKEKNLIVSTEEWQLVAQYVRELEDVKQRIAEICDLIDGRCEEFEGEVDLSDVMAKNELREIYKLVKR